MPKTEPKVGKFIKFRPEMWAALQAEADSQHRSLTNLLEVIVMEAMEAMEEVIVIKAMDRG